MFIISEEGNKVIVKQTDLRILKTRQMLKAAFYELMETVGFGKITIELLTKKAFISRNTFYLHYTDKHDMLRQFEDEVLNEIDQILNPLPLAIMQSLDKGELNNDVRQVFMELYNSVQRNLRFFNAITVYDGHPAFWGRFANVIRDHINAGYPKELFYIPVNYYTAVIVGLQTGIIREWVTGGMKETPDEIADIMIKILHGLSKSVFLQH